MTPDRIDWLVDTCGDPLYRFCLRLTGSRADADDLYQDTFLKAMESIHKIDEERNPQALLIRIAVFQWKSKWRKTVRRRRILPEGPFDEAVGVAGSDSVEDDLIAREDHAAVRRAVEGLDDKLRIPVYLHYTLDMSTEDIATALNLPRGTVKSRLHRARNRIKEEMEGEIDAKKTMGRAAG